MVGFRGSVVTVLDNQNGTLTLGLGACVVCGLQSEMTVSKAHYEAWVKDTHIQDAFPELSVDAREVLLTGIHGVCYEQLFKEGM